MSRTVLLVDDDDDLRTIGELALRDVGRWTVIVARDGVAGLREAESCHPDVILLDVMMPGLDGPATFRRLQASVGTAHIPVIFMTARVQRHERDAYVQLGAAGVIAKPFDPMRLPDQIRGILGWSAA